MPKRKERVAPPPTRDAWDVRYLTNESIKGWEDLCRTAPGPTGDCWDQLRTTPLKPKNPRRQHRLKGSLGVREVGGKPLQQWQYEVTGGGRVWYCPDPDSNTVWLAAASTGHPKATES
jgi:hypothetical protein